MTIPSAVELKELLVGAGAFMVSTMSGIGIYRFFSSGARQITRIPHSLERSAEANERMVRAVEAQSSILTQVLEVKDLQLKMLTEIQQVREERQEIGRELRIMSRKIEGFACHASEE